MQYLSFVFYKWYSRVLNQCHSVTFSYSVYHLLNSYFCGSFTDQMWTNCLGILLTTIFIKINYCSNKLDTTTNMGTKQFSIPLIVPRAIRITKLLTSFGLGVLSSLRILYYPTATSTEHLISLNLENLHTLLFISQQIGELLKAVTLPVYYCIPYLSKSCHTSNGSRLQIAIASWT